MRLRITVRTIRHKWFLLLVAFATLSIGAGAVVAVLTVARSLSAPELPYRDPGTLIAVRTESRLSWRRTLSWLDSETLLERSQSLEGIAGYLTPYANAPELGDSVAIKTCAYRGDLLKLLGVVPVSGRLPRDEESRRGDFVAVISHGLWERLFASRPDVAGQRLDLDGRPFVIIGVTPEEFYWPDREIDVWYPAARFSEARDMRQWKVIARIKHGLNPREVDAELTQISADLQHEYSATNNGVTVHAQTVADLVTSRWKNVRIALGLAIVTLIAGLVITSAVIGALQVLMRSYAFAILSALGAPPARMITSLAVESVAIGTACSALGMVFVLLVLRQLWNTALNQLVSGTNVVIVLSAAVACVIASTHFVAALWTSLNTGSLIGNKSGVLGRFASTRTLRHLNLVHLATATVVALIALGASRVVTKATSQPVGFDPKQLVVVSVSARGAGRQYGDDLMQYFAGLAEDLGRVPNVVTVASSTSVPFTDLGSLLEARYRSNEVVIESDATAPRALVRMVTPRYFDTMRIEKISGMGFAERMTANRVVVINQTLKRRAFGDEEPANRTLELKLDYRDWEAYSVVGVVGDTQWQLAQGAIEEAYIPQAVIPIYWPHNVVLRVRGNPSQLVEPLRRVAAAYDRKMPPHRVVPMSVLIETEAAELVVSERVTSYATIASLSLFAFTTWTVTRLRITRSRSDLLLRSALGATPWVLMRDMLSDCLNTSVLGVFGGMLVVSAFGWLTPSHANQQLAVIDYLAIGTAAVAINLFSCFIGLAGLRNSAVSLTR